jgi:hypothetical protein
MIILERWLEVDYESPIVTCSNFWSAYVVYPVGQNGKDYTRELYRQRYGDKVDRWNI